MHFVLFGELQILLLETFSSVQLNRTSGTVLEEKESPPYPKVLGRAHLVLPGDRARATPPVALESSKLQTLKRNQKASLSLVPPELTSLLWRLSPAISWNTGLSTSLTRSSSGKRSRFQWRVSSTRGVDWSICPPESLWRFVWNPTGQYLAPRNGCLDSRTHFPHCNLPLGTALHPGASASVAELDGDCAAGTRVPDKLLWNLAARG